MKQGQFHLACIVVSSLKPNVIPHLNKALSSVEKSAKIAKVKLTTVLVFDNNLQPPGLIHPPSLFLPVSPKIGFGARNNQAIDTCFTKFKSIDYFLLLNDDAWIEPDFVLELRKLARQNDVIIPLIYRGNQSKEIDAFGMEIFTSCFARDAEDFNIKTQWGTAACIAFNAQFIRQVNSIYHFVFNPLLYFYFEDIELGVRCLVLKPRITKSNMLVAHHYRSLTAKKNSQFIIQRTYQNYLWTIIMTLPAQTLRRNWYRITSIYLLHILKIITTLQILTVFNIIMKTILDWSKLLHLREQITSSYPDNFDITPLLSPYAFRTRRKKIPWKF